MPGLDDVDPNEVSFPEQYEPTDVPVEDPNAEASADEAPAADDSLLNTEPRK